MKRFLLIVSMIGMSMPVVYSAPQRSNGATIAKVKSLYQQGKYAQALAEVGVVLLNAPDNVEAQSYMDMLIVGRDVYNVDRLQPPPVVIDQRPTEIDQSQSTQLDALGVSCQREFSQLRDTVAQLEDRLNKASESLNAQKMQIDDKDRQIREKEYRIQELEKQAGIVTIAPQSGALSDAIQPQPAQ